MSKINVDAIDKQSGSTVTVGGPGTNLVLGTSGQSVTLGCGATQSGFGRTGTVDWQTGSIKTSTFTAANGEGYFANTSVGAFTMNLPAGSAGNIVSVVDYTNTFQTNNLTITPNGSQKIAGTNANALLSTEGQSVTLVYVDDTEGWKNVQDSTSNVAGNAFITASGGTEVTCGDFKIHVFTGPGNFVVSAVSACAPQNKVSYGVVACGGGGGRNHGGAGGAGGFREGRNSPIDSYTASPLAATDSGLTVTAQSYPVVVGGGGPGNCTCNSAPTVRKGSDSSFSTITSTGGGGGGSVNPAPYRTGGAGGSGGSGGSNGDNPGGAGNTPPVSPPQGNAGGNSLNNLSNHAGGGGGGTAAGANAPSGNGGNGGAGAATQIIGPSNPGVKGSPATNFAGGGGGGNRSGGTGGTGGTGGGGTGSDGGGDASGATSGTTNTGGGGGSAGQNPGDAPGTTAGNGGSGIVMIRYKFQ